MKVTTALVLVLGFLASHALADEKNCGANGPIPQCNGVLPQIVNGCPTCLPADGRFTSCTKAQLDACAAKVSTLQDCAPGVPPTRSTTDCCLTCKVPACTDTQLATCKTTYKTLPVCVNKMPTWDRTTCCYDCRAVESNDQNKPKQGKCTDAQVASCLAAAPVCQGNARPEFDPSQSCCGTCKRPERLCTKEQVVACKSTARDCVGTEKPQYVENECCPSCRIPEPTCTPACASTEKCVRASKDSTTGTCVDAGSLKALRVKLVPAAAQAASFKGFTCADLPALLKEIISNYCDSATNVDACTSAGNVIAAMIVAKCNKSDSSADLDVDLPPSNSVSASSNGMSLFATDATADALTVFAAAMADPSSASGYSIVVSPATRTTVHLMFSVLIASVAVFLVKLM